ncbi:MAG: putative colanic acid biosynthesis acetyltransferase [Opitutae bacterium]|nr:putative colanic acid biosynthesis acetyltransferase [Opitutae bacterium]
MSKQPLVRRQLPGRSTPWSFSQRLAAGAFDLAWALLCGWTPKPLNPWRLFVLRVFGAKIVGTPFVHQRARIALPWNVELHDRACVGDRTNLYALDRITLGAGALVAQEAYLCTGTHDVADTEWPLMTAPIVVGERAFVGARAFVLPGVTIGTNAVVGAMSVVTSDVAAAASVRGNPAR